MNDVRLPTISAYASGVSAELERSLRARVEGEVRFDRLARTLYATDASIYEITPVGVVLPRNAKDVAAAVRTCHELGTPVIPRGAGTGLTGGAVGSGVQLDLSKYLTRIGSVDVENRRVVVEPGVVLDDLNRHLASYGLHFAPDVATSSRATIGGMIANNSCGARSVYYGRTVDHVGALKTVLADGEIVEFLGATGVGDAPASSRSRARAGVLETGLEQIRDAYHDEIEARFPRVRRSNGGYGLDRLGPPGTRADATRILCGSEGTLGVVVEAALQLEPLPVHTALVVLHYHQLAAALSAVPRLLTRQPAAIELIDRLIMEAGRTNPGIRRRCSFLQGDPQAVLVVELFGDNEAALQAQARSLAEDHDLRSAAFAAVVVEDRGAQADVWNLRKAGLGLMMSRPGDEQPYSFVEDTAVDPARLTEYIRRFGALLDREGVTAGYYAHASVGCLHVKPVLNLKRTEDVQRMRRIAEAVCDLAVEFGGTISGEHGDGIVRSCWLERLYGPRLIRAFREVKQLFDPRGILNPHKIVDPWPMTEQLRQGSSFVVSDVKTSLDFSAHGGLAGMAGMCSGVGQCRQRQVGTMCPSYMATGDETHSTRARANALRIALSNRGLLEGLDDPALAEVMDLCLSCKACKTECPTGVDMARMKAEWLSRRVLREGASPRARFLADLPKRLDTLSRLPTIAHFAARRSLTKFYMERRFGLDRRLALPPPARTTFRAWFRRHVRTSPLAGHRGRVAYFVDTWMNHFTPQVGIATVRVLEQAGFQVHCPPTVCCGRVAISQGLLAEALHLARENLQILAPLVSQGMPVVGTEPSCLLTLVDEYPQLLRRSSADRLARNTMLVETFLERFLQEQPEGLTIRQRPVRLLFHGHCHQKALVGTSDTLRLLRRLRGGAAEEIPSGCCGMAGAFGHEVEHYDVAKAIGEDRLFPAVRARGEAQVVVSGFSCRMQIQQHTDATPRHFMECVAEDLVTTSERNVAGRRTTAAGDTHGHGTGPE